MDVLVGIFGKVAVGSKNELREGIVTSSDFETDLRRMLRSLDWECDGIRRVFVLGKWGKK
jgi:hypothetical protein